jgi:hypothetical protein
MTASNPQPQRRPCARRDLPRDPVQLRPALDAHVIPYAGGIERQGRRGCPWLAMNVVSLHTSAKADHVHGCHFQNSESDRLPALFGVPGRCSINAVMIRQ